MSKTQFLKDLAADLAKVLPTHVGTLKKDVEKNCQLILTKAFNQLDLVTKEQFETQSKVLLRTRKKIEALEKQVQALEKLLKVKSHGK